MAKARVRYFKPGYDPLRNPQQPPRAVGGFFAFMAMAIGLIVVIAIAGIAFWSYRAGSNSVAAMPTMAVVPSVTPTMTQTPTFTATQTPLVTTTPDLQATLNMLIATNQSVSSQTPVPTIEPSNTATPIVIEVTAETESNIGAGIAIVSVDVALIRRLPGTGYRPMQRVTLGDELRLTGKSRSGWYEVFYSGGVGWIYGGLVRIETS